MITPKEFQEARPVLRSVVAFIVALRFPPVKFSPEAVDNCYQAADCFLDQLAKDLKV